MKRVRILLRVSSNQQLEADGDLSVQRQIVTEYVAKYDDWELDKKEYFEGSNSGYKNSVSDRDILQEVYKDAEAKEFDILVVYKDDRLGRRMWEIGGYVMSLKSLGVDIYTVKDGCISPESDDIMGQMVLALRYGNAQKSSSDTGQRVKDTAQKLVQKGKFMGGKAPYGYELILSNEISKHGRALHKLRKIPEQVEVVKYIYELSYNKEFGSSKIAKVLNEDSQYKKLAINDYWKSGTITSILTNPIYCGITAYKRRERVNGKYKSLNTDDWIYAKEVNEEIKIIDIKLWNKVQEKRSNRSVRYTNTLKEKGINVITRNDGILTLIDVAYCGYCGSKLTNGSRYNYWTIKNTGEKRASKIPIYKCQGAWTGIPHNKIRTFKADKIEQIVFKYISKYINELQDNNSTYQQIINNNKKEKYTIKQQIKKVKQELEKIQNDISVMKEHIPEAMTGNYPLSLEILADTIKTFENNQKEKEKEILELNTRYKNVEISNKDFDEFQKLIPSWEKIFNEVDKQTKRVLINKIVDKIIITNEKINIKFKIKLDYNLSQHGMSGYSDTIPYTVIRYWKEIILNDLIIELPKDI